MHDGTRRWLGCGMAILLGLAVPAVATSQEWIDEDDVGADAGGGGPPGDAGPGDPGPGYPAPGMAAPGNPWGRPPTMHPREGCGLPPGAMAGPRRQGMRPWRMEALGLGPVYRLDLTDAQRTQVNAISDQLRAKNWATLGKIMDQRARLRDQRGASEPDAKAVKAAVTEIGRLRGEMAEARILAMNQARQLLTKEQREQLDRWRKEGWRARAPVTPGPPGGPR